MKKITIILTCLALALLASSGWGMSRKQRELMVIKIATGGGGGPSGPALLNEDGTRLLNEDGTYLLQE